MERYKSKESRDQTSMIPMCLDDMITPNAEVRAIDAIVDKMEIPSLEFKYS